LVYEKDFNADSFELEQQKITNNDERKKEYASRSKDLNSIFNKKAIYNIRRYHRVPISDNKLDVNNILPPKKKEEKEPKKQIMNNQQIEEKRDKENDRIREDLIRKFRQYNENFRKCSKQLELLSRRITRLTEHNNNSKQTDITSIRTNIEQRRERQIDREISNYFISDIATIFEFFFERLGEGIKKITTNFASQRDLKPILSQDNSLLAATEKNENMAIYEHNKDSSSIREEKKKTRRF